MATAVVSTCLLANLPHAVASPNLDPEPFPGYNTMGPAPVGSNDWTCKTSLQHPRPVVLVHGTGASMQETWPTVSPALKEQGYCVFALNYGGIPTWYDPDSIVWGVSDIRRSSEQLATFVDVVLARTGAQQVDIVGHSQGGTMSRQYMKFEGGGDAADPSKNKVHTWVGLGPTSHGTTFNGLQNLYSVFAKLGLRSDAISQFVFGIAGRQQLVGSTLIRELNAGGETIPGIDYTVIATRNDDIATPPENSFLSNAGGNVRNVWVQDGCPGHAVSHSGLTYDPRSLYLIQLALDPTYADHESAPCHP